MTVGAALAYTSPLNSHETYAVRKSTDTEQKTTDAATPSSAAVAGATGNTTDNAVTGTARNHLSTETTAYLVQQQAQSASDTSASGSTNDAEEIADRYFQRIATDPSFAAKQASILGNSQDGLLISNEDFPAYLEMTKGKGYTLNDPSNPVLITSKQRKDLYQREVAQGVPPEQIYADILKFNASLPASYTDRLDPLNSYPPGHYTSLQNDQLARLNAAIAQANTSEATGELS